MRSSSRIRLRQLPSPRSSLRPTAYASLTGGGASEAVCPSFLTSTSPETLITGTQRFWAGLPRIARGSGMAMRPRPGGWGKGRVCPFVFNQHFTGNLDNWDPAVLDGFAKEREVIIFNNAGIASSTGKVPTTFAGMAKNAEAFIDGLGLKNVDLLGFSIGGMVAQQITLDRPELIRK